MPRKPATPMDTANSPWAQPGDRERERAAKREAVLRMAARFFNQKGFHTTSLDDVANALNVTKPTIYHYFANKDEILFECTRRGLSAIITASREAAAQGGTGASRLHGVLMTYAMVMMDDYGICVARTQDHSLSEASRKQFRALKREIDTLIRQVVIEGVEDGSLKVRDVRIATFTAAQSLNGLGNWYNPGGPSGKEETARLVVATLMEGLSA